jgi:hypothetical protein
MSPILEGIAMSMVAAYNELQCVCQKFVTLFLSLYAAVHNELQCVYMQELCQKFVTLFVLIIRFPLPRAAMKCQHRRIDEFCDV